MLSNQRSSRFSRLAILIGLTGVGMGLAIGFLLGTTKPLYLGLAVLVVPIVFLFFTHFEQAVIGLLIVRSALDPFSTLQIPAAFALGLDALTLLYVIIMLMTRRTVHTDGFWWFLVGWMAFQGLWLILMPLGGVGLDASFLSFSIREWVRMASWALVYLLVMQLKDRTPPHKIVSGLFLALIIPLTVAMMQMFLPSLLPPIFQATGPDGDFGSMSLYEANRVRGTLGHYNTFTTFLLLFIGLTCWKLGHARQRRPWILLLGVLAFFYVSTKALFGLVILGCFLLFLLAPRLNLVNLLGGIVLFALVIGLFASTPFGQERLASIADTPLLNPDIDISRAILLSSADGNSFNWRLAQWHYLIQAWERYPILGYGLLASPFITPLQNYAHNDYVRALAEGGIIGIGAFLVFLGAQAIRLVQLSKRAAQKSPQRELCSIMLAILFALTVGMITENIWTHTTLYFYWWALFAVAA
ncbi:MAG: O-antigen ligase family protein, partial [Scytonema sp. PMC 1069.18]|nr:O-antigen ligase family protein [Scytonema sp. PMC 1069.18]